MKSAVTVSLVAEARGGPFVFWDDLPGACQTASTLGFDAIEIFAPSPESLPVEEVRALLREHRLACAAVGTGAGWVKHKLHLTHPEAPIREQAKDFAFQMIDVAGALGAAAIVGSLQGRVEPGIDRAQALDWLAEGLAALSARAAEQGASLFYEPLNRYETNLFNRAEDAARFLDERGLEHPTLLCDVFHMNIEEVSIARVLRAVAPRLGHIHFVDSNRRAVGAGHIDYAPIIAALREIGYTGYLCAETLPLPDSESAARQSIEAFRHWCGA